MCLTSNVQTMPELRDNVSNHRLKDMLAHGLCVSLCTDNRLVSNTTVVKELLLAIGAPLRSACLLCCFVFHRAAREKQSRSVGSPPSTLPPTQSTID